MPEFDELRVHLQRLEQVAAEIYQLRQEKSKPLVAAFRGWLIVYLPKVPPQSLLGKAVSCALGQWSRLEEYLEDGRLRMDNNLAENAIRPFVIGRNSWLFSGNVEGCQREPASPSTECQAQWAGTLLVPAPLFERLPLAKNENDLHALLPPVY